MIKVNSNVKLDFGKIQMLTDAQVKAMEMTAEGAAHRSGAGAGDSKEYR